MGEPLLGAPWAQAIVRAAEGAAGLPLRKLILAKPEELGRTATLQPTLLLVEWLFFEVLIRQGIAPGAVAGHSLGEFAALSAAEALPWKEAVRLVALRGQLMEEGARDHLGGMLAVLGLTPEQVAGEAHDAGCFVANYNSPGQTVLSGDTAALAVVAEQIKAKGGKAVPLPVAGAFHSPYMATANEKFALGLAQAPIGPLTVPFISSVSGRLETDPDQIRLLLSQQMTSPVRWTDALATLVSLGVEEAVEVGPGEVLARLGRRTTPCVRFRTLKEVVGNV
jgi:[acyl-carrier-protein] S-malonyltransferase